MFQPKCLTLITRLQCIYIFVCVCVQVCVLQKFHYRQPLQFSTSVWTFGQSFHRNANRQVVLACPAVACLHVTLKARWHLARKVGPRVCPPTVPGTDLEMLQATPSYNSCLQYLWFSSSTIFKKSVLNLKNDVQDFPRMCVSFSFHLDKSRVELPGHMGMRCLTLVQITRLVRGGWTSLCSHQTSPMLDMTNAVTFSHSGRHVGHWCLYDINGTAHLDCVTGYLVLVTFYSQAPRAWSMGSLSLSNTPCASKRYP